MRDGWPSWPGRNRSDVAGIAVGSSLRRFALPLGLGGLVGLVAWGALGAAWLVGTPGPLAEPAASPTAPASAAIEEIAPLATAVAALPTEAPAPPAVEPIRRHTVAPDETVRTVAERYGISVQTLIAANDLPNPDLLRVGQELLVPAVDGVVHALQPGETVRQVAERYGVPTGAVVAANGLGGNPDLVAAGTLLVVPGATPVARAAQAAEGGAAEPQQAAASTAPAGAPAEDQAASPAPELPPAGPRRLSDEPPPAVTARTVAIVDGPSAELLYGQGERTRVAPASVTKIATTLVALERAPDLAQRIPVTVSGSAMRAQDGSSIMGLEPGRDVSLATLLYGMMLPSGNDAAEQVALALAGSRERYVEWMNQKVASLGLTDTRFANPSGMDARSHYSTAYDMALLGRAAMQNETFRQLAGAATYRGDGYSLKNLNRLVGTYPGADGIKIGSTRAAGKTIVASATRAGRRVYVSLMRSQDLTGDSTALFEWVWRTFAW